MNDDEPFMCQVVVVPFSKVICKNVGKDYSQENSLKFENWGAMMRHISKINDALDGYSRAGLKVSDFHLYSRPS